MIIYSGGCRIVDSWELGVGSGKLLYAASSEVKGRLGMVDSWEWGVESCCPQGRLIRSHLARGELSSEYIIYHPVVAAPLLFCRLCIFSLSLNYAGIWHHRHTLCH